MDFLALGWSYCRNAIEQPDLYRVMFIEPVDEPDTDAFGAEVFLHVLAAAERCSKAGRLTAVEPADVAIQMWGLTHGFVTFALRGVLTVEDMVEHLSNATLALLIGYGDSPTAARRSVRTMRRRMEREQPFHGSLAPEKPTLATSIEASGKRTGRSKNLA